LAARRVRGRGLCRRQAPVHDTAVGVGEHDTAILRPGDEAVKAALRGGHAASQAWPAARGDRATGLGRGDRGFPCTPPGLDSGGAHQAPVRRTRERTTWQPHAFFALAGAAAFAGADASAGAAFAAPDPTWYFVPRLCPVVFTAFAASSSRVFDGILRPVPPQSSWTVS
jgi:hypothetical protein